MNIKKMTPSMKKFATKVLAFSFTLPTYSQRLYGIYLSNVFFGYPVLSFEELAKRRGVGIRSIKTAKEKVFKAIRESGEFSKEEYSDYLESDWL